MPPYHIMHVVHGLNVGGMEIMLNRLVKRLDPRRFRSTVCCFDVRGSLTEDLEQAGAEVLLLPRKPGVDYRYPFRLAQLFRNRKADLAHLHSEMGFIYGVPAAHLAGTRGIIYTEHGRHFPATRRKTVANSLLSALRVHTVPVSRALRDNLIAYERFRPHKMTVIHNGVPDPLRPDDETIRKIRSEMGAGRDNILLGTMGRLMEVKDHIGLIRAMPALLATHPQARLAILGRGVLHDFLQREIRHLGLEKTVVLAGERIDVAPYLHAFDVFVLSSKSEGLPLCLLESLAAEKPAVAMKVGGVAEVMDDGVEGFLVEPANYQQFVQRLRWLIDRPDVREAMGKRGRQKYLCHFTIERMVARYSALYEKLLVDPAALVANRGPHSNGVRALVMAPAQKSVIAPAQAVSAMN